MADFGGRYRLDRCLGTGGMGQVWLAYDEELADRPVAIKVMRAPADEAGLARFQREMRLASRMHHPNIMTVFTTGSDQGVPFMVMEYLQGRDLGTMRSGWSAGDVAQIGREACGALSYAHGLDPGVVHRDIKPGNLFICDTGTVKVTDFGLAKAITETGTERRRRRLRHDALHQPRAVARGGRPPSATTSGHWAASCTSCWPAG